MSHVPVVVYSQFRRTEFGVIEQRLEQVDGQNYRIEEITLVDPGRIY